MYTQEKVHSITSRDELGRREMWARCEYVLASAASSAGERVCALHQACSVRASQDCQRVTISGTRAGSKNEGSSIGRTAGTAAAAAAAATAAAAAAARAGAERGAEGLG